MSYHLLGNHRLGARQIPIWYVEDGHTPSIGDDPLFSLFRALQPVDGRSWIAFRGVPIQRLDALLDNGVDVDPTDTVIFCAEEDKAFEYARSGWGEDGPGLLYALHGGYLERSFCTLPADASPEEIAEVRKTYPHEYPDQHGGQYFSRLADQNNTAYEIAYGYWIPGAARDALLAVFVRGELDALKECFNGLPLRAVD